MLVCKLVRDVLKKFPLSSSASGKLRVYKLNDSTLDTDASKASLAFSSLFIKDSQLVLTTLFPMDSDFLHILHIYTPLPADAFNKFRALVAMSFRDDVGIA